MNHQISDNTHQYLFNFENILNTMIYGMYNATLTNNISLNFINQMVPHHKGAIQMSENLLNYTTSLKLQSIAQNIINTQNQSIRDMLNAHFFCLQNINSPQDINRYLNEIENIIHRMFDRMQNAPQSNDININFINEMIPHHEGAIQMAKTTLQYRLCPQLTSILQAIITSQQQGVEEMKQLL